MSASDRGLDAVFSHGSTSKVSGFLTEPLAREIIDGITGPRLRRGFAEALRWFPAINRAHLVMLTEQGLMEPDVAGRLLSHIDDLEREGVAAFALTRSGRTPGSTTRPSWPGAPGRKQAACTWQGPATT